MKTHEIDSWLWDESRAAATAWFRAQCAAPWASFHLYYLPQGARLVVAQNKPNGFELASVERMYPSYNIELAMNWIYYIARSLPVSTPAMAD